MSINEGRLLFDCSTLSSVSIALINDEEVRYM